MRNIGEDTIIKEFKDGIFDLRTRRFGTVAELMIKHLEGLDFSYKSEYDLKNDSCSRVECKFSTVLRKSTTSITEDNVVEQILEARGEKRALRSSDIVRTRFDCNIQQVKPSEFDLLYYGCFFYDKVFIFSVSSEDVKKLPNYSDKQHRGNVGEGQFHLNNQTIEYHIQNNLHCCLNYKTLMRLLKKEPIDKTEILWYNKNKKCKERLS